MFGKSRALLEAVETLCGVASHLVESVDLVARHLSEANVLREMDAPGALDERLKKLELSRSLWEAEMEAEVLKAKGKYQAASNAEGRARTQAKFDEENAPPSDPDLGEGIAPEGGPELLFGDVPPGGQTEMLPLPVGVEATPKEARKRLKFL